MDSNNPNVPAFHPRDNLQAIYANLVRISHSPGELVMDFALLLPGNPDAEILNRVLMSPLGAKLFFMALAENLKRYESAFGEITLPGEHDLARSLFKGIQPPDKPTDT